MGQGPHPWESSLTPASMTLTTQQVYDFFLDQGEAQWHQHHQGRATGLKRPNGQCQAISQHRTAVAAAPQWPGRSQNCHRPRSGHTSNLGPTRERGAPMPTHTRGPCQALRASPSPAQVSTTLRGVTPHRRSISTQPLSPGGLVQLHVSNADGATRGPDSRGQSWE